MTNYVLVADVGGTNARLALSNLDDNSIGSIRNYLCDDFNSLAEILDLYLSELDVKILDACIAIACPIHGDTVTMTNQSWTFSIEEIKRRLSLRTLKVINDFTAISYAIPTLKENQLIQIGGTKPQPGFPKAVYGAGTGLGVAHLVPTNDQWLSISGEGGHQAFAPSNEEEDNILKYLRKTYGHVSVERILSGPGLVNIHNAVRYSRGLEIVDLTPQEITTRASNNECEICVDVLDIFCSVFGRFGGDLALNIGAFGGVYIAGGVIPKFLEYFLNSNFREAFLDKGRFKDYLKDIPVYLINAEQVGLLGAAFQIKQSINS
jgi:glucokinase